MNFSWFKLVFREPKLESLKFGLAWAEPKFGNPSLGFSPSSKNPNLGSKFGTWAKPKCQAEEKNTYYALSAIFFKYRFFAQFLAKFCQKCLFYCKNKRKIHVFSARGRKLAPQAKILRYMSKNTIFFKEIGSTF